MTLLARTGYMIASTLCLCMSCKHNVTQAAAYRSAIIGVFPRGLALFDATVLSLLVFSLY